MWSLREPSADSLRHFLASQSTLEYTYPEVGATARTPPAGYVVDHNRVRLGTGEQTFAAANSALKRWEHFRLGWVDAWPRNAPIEPGEVVVVRARVLGLWSINACRVVYVVDEEGPIAKFGFAYGTLPGHAESGEERFLIEWDHADGSVWYDILAFSKPSSILTRLGYPVARMLQKRFARDSMSAMLRAVGTFADR